MNFDYEIGGGWGNAINWTNPEDFSVPHDSTTKFRVVGWKQCKPTKGDILKGEFEKSFRYFKFVKVESCGDPPDMFFADVVCVEVVPK